MAPAPLTPTSAPHLAEPASTQRAAATASATNGAVGAPEEHRVRPLPSTEPGPRGTRGEPVLPPAAVPRPAPEDGVPVPARRAGHALVTMALEVVDRKRAPQNTRGAFPPHLVEMLRTLAREGVPGRHLGPARIHRLHIHAAGPGHPAPGEAATAGYLDYEVCATYARGPRLFAVAARIRVGATGAACTALRLV